MNLAFLIGVFIRRAIAGISFLVLRRLDPHRGTSPNEGDCHMFMPEGVDIDTRMPVAATARMPLGSGTELRKTTRK